MDEKLSWYFQLIDRVTAPAKSMQGALGRVQTTLNNMTKTGGGPFKRFTQGSVGQLQRFSQGLKTLGSAGGSALSVLGSIAAPIGLAATVGAGLAVAGGVWVASSISLKENADIAFETILKSKDAAKRVMANAIAFAGATPFDTAGVIANYQRLLVAGFKETELNTVLAGAGDLGAAFGNEKMDQAIGAFQKIKAQGKLTGESIQMLGDAGINVGLVYEQLGKQFGTTAKGAQDLISKGKIDANSGIVASLNVIKDTISGGELGGMMAKQSKTLSGLWSSLTSRPFELVIAADSTGAMGGLKTFLANVTAALDPESATGKRIMNLFTTIGDGVAKVFGDLGKGATVEGALNGILNVLEPLAKLGITFYGAMSKAFAPGVIAAFKMFASVDTSTMTTFLTNMSALGRLMGYIASGALVVAAGVVMVAAGLASLIGFIWDQVEWILGNFREFGAALGEIGVNLMKGLADGIVRGAAAVTGAISGVGKGAVDTMKSILGIQSPSKVFEQLGVYSAEGFNQGLASGDMQGAMNDNARPPSFVGGALGGGSGTTIDLGGISVVVHVQGAAASDPQAVGQAVAEQVEARVASMLDRLMAQAG